MPFVAIRKARPEWQDTRPADPALRDAYAIAGRNVGAFSTAFAATVRSLVTPAVLRAVRQKIAAGGRAEEIVDLLPWFNEAQPESVTAWEKLGEKLTAAYAKVIRESGASAAQELTAKAKRTVPVVPVNPAAVRWAKERGAKLVRETSTESKRIVRNVVAREMARGVRAERMVAVITRTVGLLEREEAAVDRRHRLLLDQGVSDDRADKLSDKYADQLLRQRGRRIARTETIAAQNQGLLFAWLDARDAGQLPAVEREWSASPPSPRTCAICLELDGTTTGLDEPFESAILGEAVMMPPAHPSCRCTVKLRRKQE